MQAFNLWWEKLTKENWGFPYHWIRQIIIVSLVFGVFKLDLIYMPWVYGPLFVYSLVEGFYQYSKTKKIRKEVQDLLADYHALFFSLYMYADKLSDWFFWILTLVCAGVLYWTMMEEDNGKA